MMESASIWPTSSHVAPFDSLPMSVSVIVGIAISGSILNLTRVPAIVNLSITTFLPAPLSSSFSSFSFVSSLGPSFSLTCAMIHSKLLVPSLLT